MADGTETKTSKHSPEASAARNKLALAIIRKASSDESFSGGTKQLSDDPFTTLSENGEVVEPPFDMLTLAMLREHSTELPSCVEAMEVNIEGFGHRYQPRVDLELPSATEETKRAVARERVFLENFFTYASTEMSFTALRRRMRHDLETTGNAYFEVIRNADTGKVTGLEHIPSFTMRLGCSDSIPFQVEQPILEMQEDGSVAVVKRKVHRRFRRFVQSRIMQRYGHSTSTGGGDFVWFKQFGDPRRFSARSGTLIPEGQENVSPQDLANEVVHFRIYSPRSPYGLPRFIGNLLSIFGDRAAEEINFVTFKNNNIPSMAILVSDGGLTQGSLERLKTFVESQVQGSSNYSQMLLLEAEPSSEIGGSDTGNIKMQIVPLTKEQHSDALFQNYSKENRERIRCSFRLPPIFLGRADDYSKATAEESRKLADEQVFDPERQEFDVWVNRDLFPHLGVTLHKFKSNTPNTTDNTELVAMLSAAERTGGLTPRIARTVMEDVFGRDLPGFPTDAKVGSTAFDPDLPFSLAMAEAVKNRGLPTEPGQQVTALKSDTPDAGALVGAFTGQPLTVEALLAARDDLERRWREEMTGPPKP